ncbi:MAG: hypothetical protein R3272_16675, partial [Candidatus Promineifilaceae bacterium]|nr:hypothetical protein [Candidatus Promineifilaceae bacterium]
MSEDIFPLTADAEAPAETERGRGATIRFVRYVVLRMVALFLTVVVGVYLSILIANMGGYVDEIRRGQIREQVGQQIGLSEEFRQLTTEERNALIAEQVALEERRLGLDRPF